MHTILTISRSSLNFIYVTIFIWYIQSMRLFILFGSIYGFSYMLTHDRHCSCHSLLQSPITAACSQYSVSISFSELSHGMFKKVNRKNICISHCLSSRIWNCFFPTQLCLQAAGSYIFLIEFQLQYYLLPRSLEYVGLFTFPSDMLDPAHTGLQELT